MWVHFKGGTRHAIVLFFHSFKLIQSRVAGGVGGAYPSCHWARGGVPVHHRHKRDAQLCTLALTPRENLESPDMHVFGRWEEAGVPGENPNTDQLKAISYIYHIIISLTTAQLTNQESSLIRDLGCIYQH